MYFLISPASLLLTLTVLLVDASVFPKYSRFITPGRIPGPVPKFPSSEQNLKTSENRKRQIDVIMPPNAPTEQLDLAFIMDTTGSMTAYIESARQNIREIVDEIVANSKSDVRLALIEYRDHRPQEHTFATRKHDFTYSVGKMKSWLNRANAKGGGDRPEAVADALFQTTTLSWRPEATKIGVLISDAPPHGLVPSQDRSFPQGSPNGHDPIKTVRDLAQIGVTLYVIGCEPAINPYKDFFLALAYMTGGQYVPLSEPAYLVDAIIGGAEEELSLQKYEGTVEKELQEAARTGETIDKHKIVESLFEKLQKAGAKTKKLIKNKKALKGPSAAAKLLAKLTSMSDVRKNFNVNKGSPRPSISSRGKSAFSSFMDRPLRKRIGPVGHSDFGVRSGAAHFLEKLSLPHIPSEDRSRTIRDKLSTIESGITKEQLERLVEKESSKFKGL